MKIKTSELTGAALDWAVAKCEGALNTDMGTCRNCSHLAERGISDGSEYHCWLGDLDWCDGGFHSDNPFGEGISVDYGVHQQCPLKMGTNTEAYSTDWSQGGPIIEREAHNLFKHNGGTGWCCACNVPRDGYIALVTPLITAMRCYVASKMGDEIEVPEELCSR